MISYIYIKQTPNDRKLTIFFFLRGQSLSRKTQRPARGHRYKGNASDYFWTLMITWRICGRAGRMTAGGWNGKECLC